MSLLKEESVPSTRFENLAEEKKEKIIEAAIEEFIERGYERASINSIIKMADISRGSFYTYFEDKDDILSYIINSFTAKSTEFIINTLKESNGDIIEMMIRLYDIHIKFKKEHPNSILSLFNTMAERVFSLKKAYSDKEIIDHDFFKSKNGERLCELLWENSNEHLKKYTRQKFTSLIELIFAVAFKSVITAEICGEVAARNQMVDWLGFIKNGI